MTELQQDASTVEQMSSTEDGSTHAFGPKSDRRWFCVVRRLVVWSMIGLFISLAISHSVETLPFSTAQRRGMTRYGANDFVISTEWRTFATSFSSFQRFEGARAWESHSPQTIAAELRTIRDSMDWTTNPMVGVASLVWQPAGDGVYYLIERGFPFVAQYSAFSMPPDEKLTLEQKSGVTSVGFAGHSLVAWLPQIRWMGLFGNTAICGSAAWLLVAGPVFMWKFYRRRLRRNAGACIECGYPLSGHANGQVCPECGRSCQQAG